MKKGFAILFLIVAVSFASTAELTETFVAGGVNAFPGEFPYLVSLQLTAFGQSSHFCGGTILSPLWILTAAHCLTSLPIFGNVEVFAGRHNLAVLSEAGQARHSIINTFIHPGWRIFAENEPNDVALIRLINPLPFSDRIRAIRLPQTGSSPNGVAAMPSWGNIGIAASILQRANLILVHNLDCQRAVDDLNFRGTIDLVNGTNVCTGPFTGTPSICNGDFGGPIIQGTAPNEVIVGIASWGVTPCRSVGAPSGIFVNVSAFNHWIFSVTGLLP